MWCLYNLQNRCTLANSLPPTLMLKISFQVPQQPKKSPTNHILCKQFVPTVTEVSLLFPLPSPRLPLHILYPFYANHQSQCLSARVSAPHEQNPFGGTCGKIIVKYSNYSLCSSTRGRTGHAAAAALAEFSGQAGESVSGVRTTPDTGVASRGAS